MMNREKEDNIDSERLEERLRILYGNNLTHELRGQFHNMARILAYDRFPSKREADKFHEEYLRILKELVEEYNLGNGNGKYK